MLQVLVDQGFRSYIINNAQHSLLTITATLRTRTSFLRYHETKSKLQAYDTQAPFASSSVLLYLFLMHVLY